MKSAYEYTKELVKNVKPSMSYDGGDFKKWQKEARGKLCELLGMDKFTKVAPETHIEYEREEKEYKEIRFVFKSEEGYHVPCHMLIPNNAANPPVMICLQGHSKGMHISLARAKYEGDEETIKGGDRDFCIRAVREGYAAICMEQRNFGECGGNEHGPQCWEASMNSLLVGRCTIGERVWDISRLIDVIEKDFSHIVNSKTILCMGNSGGGTATAYTAALEDRISLAMPSCAMCTYKDSIAAMKHCMCNYVPDIALFFEMSDLMAMAYPKYFVQVSGKEDNIFPVGPAKYVFDIGKAIYEKMGAGDRCAFVEGNGGHRFYADDAWPIVHKFIQ